MNITIDIKPEVQTELARQAAIQGRAIEAVAATLFAVGVNMPFLLLQVEQCRAFSEEPE